MMFRKLLSRPAPQPARRQHLRNLRTLMTAEGPSPFSRKAGPIPIDTQGANIVKSYWAY